MRRSGKRQTWPPSNSISCRPRSSCSPVEVDQVDIPGSEGDFGVFAGHAPVVATHSSRHHDGVFRRQAGEDLRARRACRGVGKGPDGACRSSPPRSRISTGRRLPGPSPRWKPRSHGLRKAASWTRKSPGSTTSRRSYRTSKALRCISQALRRQPPGSSAPASPRNCIGTIVPAVSERSSRGRPSSDGAHDKPVAPGRVRRPFCRNFGFEPGRTS